MLMVFTGDLSMVFTSQST